MVKLNVPATLQKRCILVVKVCDAAPTLLRIRKIDDRNYFPDSIVTAHVQRWNHIMVMLQIDVVAKKFYTYQITVEYFSSMYRR